MGALAKMAKGAQALKPELRPRVFPVEGSFTFTSLANATFWKESKGEESGNVRRFGGVHAERSSVYSGALGTEWLCTFHPARSRTGRSETQQRVHKTARHRAGRHTFTPNGISSLRCCQSSVPRLLSLKEESERRCCSIVSPIIEEKFWKGGMPCVQHVGK